MTSAVRSRAKPFSHGANSTYASNPRGKSSRHQTSSLRPSTRRPWRRATSQIDSTGATPEAALERTPVRSCSTPDEIVAYEGRESVGNPTLVRKHCPAARTLAIEENDSAASRRTPSSTATSVFLGRTRSGVRTASFTGTSW